MTYQKGDRVVLDEHGQEHAGTVSELRDGYMMIEWDNGSLPSPLEADDVRPMADGEVIAPPTLDPVVEASKAFQAALVDGATREQAATVWEESYDRLSDSRSLSDPMADPAYPGFGEDQVTSALARRGDPAAEDDREVAAELAEGGTILEDPWEVVDEAEL